MFTRRLDLIGNAPLSLCSGGHSCPAVLEMESGDFAIIGADITEFAEKLPMGCGCGPNERLVRVPRETLLRARPNIPVT